MRGKRGPSDVSTSRCSWSPQPANSSRLIRPPSDSPISVATSPTVTAWPRVSTIVRSIVTAPMIGQRLPWSTAEARTETPTARLEAWRVEGAPQRLDLVPAHARAAHPGIDLEVEGALAAGGPTGDRLRVAEHGGEAKLVELVEQCGLHRHEDDHGAGDPCRSKLR